MNHKQEILNKKKKYLKPHNKFANQNWKKNICFLPKITEANPKLLAEISLNEWWVLWMCWRFGWTKKNLKTSTGNF